MTGTPSISAALAEEARDRADISTMAAGFVWQAETANDLIETGRCQMVALARELLADPDWTLHAAAELGHDERFARWKPEFGWWLDKRERVMQKLGMRDAP